jgi:hypothetical protein
MPHAIHKDGLRLVVDLVNDAVLANANSPILVASGQFSATGRTRILSQLLNCRDLRGYEVGLRVA